MFTGKTSCTLISKGFVDIQGDNKKGEFKFYQVNSFVDICT